MNPIPAPHGQGDAAALLSCPYRTGVGSFGDLVVVTRGVTGRELQLLGCFCGSGALARAAESCQMLPAEGGAGGLLLQLIPRPSRTLLPQHGLGFGQLDADPGHLPLVSQRSLAV